MAEIKFCVKLIQWYAVNYIERSFFMTSKSSVLMYMRHKLIRILPVVLPYVTD
mgnify:CR=1 FL=1